jgi:hypothetical protein
MNILNEESIHELIQKDDRIKGCIFEKIKSYLPVSSQLKKVSAYDTTIIGHLDNLILKIQKEPNHNEIELQQKASEMNLAPKIYEVYVCKKGDEIKSYAFIMEELDVSLEDYIKDDSNSSKNKRQMIEKIIIKLQQLNKNHIMHNDSLTRNFMIKKEEPFIIDFGQSTYGPSNLSDFNRLYNDLIDTLCPNEKHCTQKTINLLEYLLAPLDDYIDHEKRPGILYIPKSLEQYEEENLLQKLREEENKRKEEEQKQSNTPVQMIIKEIFDKKRIHTIEDYNKFEKKLIPLIEKETNLKNVDLHDEIEKAKKLYL